MQAVVATETIGLLVDWGGGIATILSPTHQFIMGAEYLAPGEEHGF